MADEQELPDPRPEAAPPPPAKKAPAKAAKKAPTKRAPAKKTPAKAAAKPAPPKKAVPVAPIADGAKQAAAEAKSTVELADDTLSKPTLVSAPQPGRSPLPIAVAIALSLLAILLVRRLRQDDADES